MGMDFPIADLLDEHACYRALLGWLHPGGRLACPRCGATEGLGVHRRHRDPVLDYRCGACGRVFNAFTDTPLHAVRRRPSDLVLILRGVARGEPTAQLARELHAGRGHLLELRHRASRPTPWPPAAKPTRPTTTSSSRSSPPPPPPLMMTRARPTRCSPTRGKKGRRHPDPAGPPRRRANRFHGRGTWDHDRPPVLGVVSRAAGKRLSLAVVTTASRAELEPRVLARRRPPGRRSTPTSAWRTGTSAMTGGGGTRR